MPQTNPARPSTTGFNAAQSAFGPLARLRFLSKALLLLHRAGWIIAAAIVAIVVGGVLDFYLLAPNWLRTVGLIAAAVLLAGALAQRLLPVFRYNPSLEDIALRLERAQQGTPSGRPIIGFLASAVGLRPAATDSRPATVLAHGASQQAAQRLANVRLSSVIRAGPAARAGAILALSLIAVLGLLATEPALSAIGIRRMLLPWTEATWPKRYRVADLTATTAHPLGSALLLRGALVRSPVAAERAEVEARFSLIIDGRRGPVRTAALTSQGRTAQASIDNEAGNAPGTESTTLPGAVFERLIEAAAVTLPPSAPDTATAASPAKPAIVELEYTITSGDDTTAPRRIRLVEPPAVIAASATITPPAYAPADPALAARGERALGRGSDERAVVPGVLAGSTVALTLDFNKPINPPAATDTAALAKVFGADLAALPGITLQASGTRWTLTLPITSTLRVSVRLRDEFDIPSGDETNFRFEARADRAPEATVTLPAEDIEVTTAATVSLTGEGRDDLELASTALIATIARPAAGSVGGAPEPVGQPRTLATIDISDGARTATVKSTLELAPMAAANQIAPGSEMWIAALASDKAIIDGTPRAPTQSAWRRLRIISQERLAEQLYNDLQNVRKAAIRAAEMQASIRTQSQAKAGEAKAASDAALQTQANKSATPQDKSAASAKAEQAMADMAQAMSTAQAQQGALTDAISKLAQQAEAAKARADANATTDKDIDSLIKQATAALDTAKADSSDASARLQQAASASKQAAQAAKAAQASQANDAAATDAQAQQAASDATAASDQAKAEQDNVERSLEQLAKALDKGQDSWSSKKSLERLAAEQRDLREATAKLGQDLVGKNPAELSDKERQAAEAIAQKQDDLAERTKSQIESMQQQSKSAQKSDPAAASALAEAAKRGQRADVAKKMQDAASQVRQNQAGEAQQQQETAEGALKAMLDELNQAQKNRDAVLRREMVSLMASIDGLIVQQESSIAQLESVIAKAASLLGLDAPMIRLHGATLDTAERASAAGKDAEKVQELLKAAGDSMVAAIGTLRAAGGEGPTALNQEKRALTSLREAKAAAKTAGDEAKERAEEQIREELRKAYQDLAADQTIINSDTLPVIGKPFDRRVQRTASALANRQDLLVATLKDLLERVKELGDSQVFSLAHERIEAAGATASTMLRTGQWTALLRARQEAIVRLLNSLAEALGEPKDDPQFRENEQGDQGGQGGQQGQKEPVLPPIAELQLLRRLQTEALRSTAEASEGGEPAMVEAARQDAIKMQSELAKRSKILLEKLSAKQGMGQ